MKRLLFFLLVSFTGLSCSNMSGELSYYSAHNQMGFEYPYFLFIPEGIQKSDVFLMVEPNNTGFVSDDFDDHMESAENLASNASNLGNFLAHELKAPLLVPIFPRSDSNWQVYTHALDRDAMLEHGTSISRIDLQLLAMIEDARLKLLEAGITIKNKVLMTGFSASGTFVNRFVAIHPNKVMAAAGGGLNGMLILPVKNINGTLLNYPLGIHDLDKITGKPFDSTAFKNTPQFLFMGGLDDNDAAPYSDAYSDSERKIIYDILGEEMLPNRWDKCMQIYTKCGITGLLKTYPKVGHEPSDDIKVDILSFFRDVIEGNPKF